MPLSKRSYLWLALTGGMLAALILAALVLPRSFALTAFSDIVQSLLLASGTAAFALVAWRSHGRVRLFWWLLTLGAGFWLAYQIFWTYSEVLLRRDVPDLCTWDVVLFLHIVPPMAALALRPHVPRDEYAARVGQLDFALLLVWWFYLYVLIVMPWQYVMPDVAAYNRNLNDVYLAEKLALLAGLVACWITSKGQWRKLYAALFGMNLCYSAEFHSGELGDRPQSLTTAAVFTTSRSSQPWLGSPGSGLRSQSREAGCCRCGAVPPSMACG